MHIPIRIVSNKNQEKSKEEVEKSKELVRVAKERFALAVEAETDIRKEAIEDIEFKIGMQWPTDVKALREKQGRPCLTINKIPQHIRQITNEQRQNRSSLKVSPVDNEADVFTAKIKQGLLRHIEYNSNADLAYDNAFDGSASGGFGYWRIITDYVSPMSFDQEILVKPIDNQFTVHTDPNSKMIDGSDMNWCLIDTEMPKEDYKAEYGDSELAKTDDWASDTSGKSWINKESCRVVEYFYKTYEDVEIVLLSNGQVLEKSIFEKTKLPEGIKKLDERKSKKPVINWAILNGIEVLMEKKWPGSWIPVIPVYGGRVNLNGKIFLESVIRYTKDSQRMNNYMASSEAEVIALAPKAPWLVSAEQIEGYEHIWENANTETYSYLPYNQFDSQGNQLSAPTRNVFEPPVQAITNARMLSADDMKSTTGQYDASLGNRSNEQSGVAINKRTVQAQTSNFHFIDNLNYSKKHSGKIMLELIDIIYDAPRTIRILGENGEEEIVRINEAFKDKDGEQKTYNFSSGKYDLTIDNGPSFATKRQETTSAMIEVAKVFPKLLEVAGDKFIANMDWNESKEISDRVKKSMPPALVDDKKQSNQEIPPQIQAQMQEMTQQNQQLTESLNQQNEIVKTKKLELESRERIEAAKLEVELIKEQMKMAPNLALQNIMNELQQINNRQLSFEQNYLNQKAEAGLNQETVVPNEQQPTGGQQSPGQPVGVNDEQRF